MALIYRCIICGTEALERPPLHCPKCGVPAGRWRLVVDRAPVAPQKAPEAPAEPPAEPPAKSPPVEGGATLPKPPAAVADPALAPVA